MGDKAAIALAESLSSNASLTSLAWDDNEINLGGWQAFASCLRSNKTLKVVPPPFRDIYRALEGALLALFL
jgi:hypothetical protein